MIDASLSTASSMRALARSGKVAIVGKAKAIAPDRVTACDDRREMSFAIDATTFVRGLDDQKILPAALRRVVPGPTSDRKRPADDRRARIRCARTADRNRGRIDISNQWEGI